MGIRFLYVFVKRVGIFHPKKLKIKNDFSPSILVKIIELKITHRHLNDCENEKEATLISDSDSMCELT